MTVSVPNAASPLASAFTSARKVAVPLIVVRTTDPAAATDTIATALPDTKPVGDKPLLAWDTLNGLRPLNAPGQAAIAKVVAAGMQAQTIAFSETLVTLQKAPAQTCVLAYNAHLQWNDPQSKQGIWNLRDQFKTNQRTLVLLTTPGATVPVELQNDVITIDEPLPTADQLGEVVRNIYISVNQAVDEPTISKAVDALAGVRSNFTAEQITAMSMTKQGVNLDALWTQKKQLVNDTPGLTWIEPTITFKELGGTDALKEFFTLLFHGEAPPSVIVWLDEINDMFGGVEGDNTGVAQAIHGKFLTTITDTDAKGVLLMGHPGTGKSAIIAAAAAEFGVPVIRLDFGDVKTSALGASEERTTAALQVIDAISFGQAVYVGTCNEVSNLSAQLLRRFTWRFFFDLPTDAEKKMIWPVYEQHPHAKAKAGLRPDQTKDRPDDTDMTGAEIREVCEYAWRFNTTLKKAAQYVVPIAASMPEGIDARRKFAANRYLSASYPGTYRLKGESTVKPTTEPVKIPARMVRALAEMDES